MTTHYVAGVFQDAPSFKQALASLIDDGFPHEAVSVLADQQALDAHILDDAPPAEDEADDHSVVKTAIHLFAEGLATIGMIGTAGVAYAVGGPIGLAATAGDSTELTVENFLADHVDQDHHQIYEQAIQQGGVVCWVHVQNDDEENRARRVLNARHAEHVHIVHRT